MYTISNAKKIQNSHSATLARATCPKNVSVMSVSFRNRLSGGEVGQTDTACFRILVAGTRRGIAHQRPKGGKSDEQQPDLDVINKGVSGGGRIEHLSQMPRGGHAADPVTQTPA